MHKQVAVGIVLFVLLSALVVAIHTPETRYSFDQPTVEQRDIVFTQNRLGQNYVRPFGGFGQTGASKGSMGMTGVEEGASNLATNSFIYQGRTPGRISNMLESMRGYRIVNKYVQLDPLNLELSSRPQINGTPQGYARIISRKTNDVIVTEGIVMLRTKDLPPVNPDYLYEAWLVDEDTGYAMTLGLFQAGTIGRTATLSYKSMTPLDPFDTIMVTVEPFPDDNPMPGQVVITGSLNAPYSPVQAITPQTKAASAGSSY
jgi:hypothetical protein